MFNRVTIAVGLAATLTLSATASLAQDGREAGRMFERLDSDGNGVISRAEMNEAAQMRFQRKDANNDGFLDIDEVMARWVETPADANGDGRLSASEHAALAAAMFQRIDANSDGEVNRAEARAFRERMSERREQKQ